MKALITLAAALLAVAGPARAQDCATLLENTTPRLVASGFKFTEGPAWSPQGFFIFSDIPANVIYRLDPSGAAAPLVTPSGFANGNSFSAAGVHYAARHDRSLAVISNGVSAVIASEFQGKKLNSPNDLVVARDGSVWFSDPDFGITGYGPQIAQQEQPVRGVYRWNAGALTLMTGELTEPNGLAFSPDEKILYVADTADGAIYRFDVSASGGLSGKKRFAFLAPRDGQKPSSDGLRVDRRGNVWAVGPASVGVINPAGQEICRVAVQADHVSNLAFGGADGKDILITASDKLYALRLK